MFKRILLSVGSFSVAFLLLSGAASAQSDKAPGEGNGLSISPVRNDLVIKPGESKTIDIYIQNITGKTAEFSGVVNDFVASEDESGSPRIILDDKVAAPTRGVKDYVDKIANVTLEPQERKLVKVRIAMPADAAGGGYFGAVRFLPASVDSSQNVSLSASVASLLLVTVPGDVKEQASISAFNVSREGGRASTLFTNGAVNNNKGLQATLRVKNSGNVQVAPFGKIVLKKSGNVLLTSEINNVQPRGNVLPDSTRRFVVDLGDKTAGFGKYTLEGNFGYGSNGQLISAKTSFYVVPLPYLLVGVGLLLVLIAAVIIAPRWLKSHDRKLLRKVRGSKRR